MAAVTAASSALLMVFVMPIPFGSTKLGVEVAGWYVPVPVLVLLGESGSCHLCTPTSSIPELFWLSVGWIMLGRVILDCG